MRGRHDGLRIAAMRNRGELQEDQIVWGMDLVPYTPSDGPGRHSMEAAYERGNWLIWHSGADVGSKPGFRRAGRSASKHV